VPTSTPYLVTLGLVDTLPVTFACSGATSVGDGAVLVGNINSFGAITLGADAKLTGKMDCYAAVTIGYEARVSAGKITIPDGIVTECDATSVLAQGAITIAANAIVCANVTSGAAVTVGALAQLVGVVSYVGSITLGADAAHDGSDDELITVEELDESTNPDVIDDIELAYDEAFEMTGWSIITGDGVPLIPGLYRYTSAFALANGATLTLNGGGDPNAEWLIVVVGACAIYGSIVLEDGAQASNVQWVVNGEFVVATGQTFYGSVIAKGAIATGASARFMGKMLTVNGGAINIGALSCNIGSGTGQTFAELCPWTQSP
jgi:uncharacterized metal-binding protein